MSIVVLEIAKIVGSPKALRWLALVTTSTAFAVMVMGSYTSKSGAGLACPDWPLCHGRLIPVLTWPVFLEWTHRLLVVVLSALTLMLVIATWSRKQEEQGKAYIAILALGLLALQVALGGATIFLRLHPLVVTAHQAVALLFFGTLVWLTSSTYRVVE